MKKTYHLLTGLHFTVCTLAIEGYLAPLLIGQLAADINRVRRSMTRRIRGNSFAKSTRETKWPYAQGQRLDLSIESRLDGAQHEALPVLWTLASDDVETDIADADAERLLSEGRHNQFKLKAGPKDACAYIDLMIEQPDAAGQSDVLVRLSQDFDVAQTAYEAINDMQDGPRLTAAELTARFLSRWPNAWLAPADRRDRRGPLTYADSGVAVPTAPDVGMRINEDKLEHYRRYIGYDHSSIAAQSPARGECHAV